MDDRESRGPGGRPDDDQTGDDRAHESDQEYYWGGRPGEDFGPIVPPEPPPAPRSGERRPTSQHDYEVDPVWAETQRVRLPDRGRGRGGEPLRPDGIFTPPVRRRRFPFLTVLGILLVLGGLTAAVLILISPERVMGLLPGTSTSDPVPSPAPAAASPAATAVPAPSPAAPAPKPAQTPAASPTPLVLGQPTPSRTPTAVRSPVSKPTARPGPAILPNPPALMTPGGLQFPTATPARLTTPQLFRTPPTVPSPRLPNVSTRVWSEQVIHRVGDHASICGQSSSGANAQLLVIAPDRSPRTLGEFALPAERVCFTLNVDQPELWVLTLIVRDENANEIDRQSAALWVGR